MHCFCLFQDGRIGALEKEIKLLEDEMLHMREEAAAGVMPDGRTTSGSDLQVETLKSQEKLLKAKVTIQV